MAANDIMNQPESPSVTGLVSGIMTDAQELMKQQVALVRSEIKSEFRRSFAAAMIIGAGSLLAMPAMFLLGNFLVYLLHEERGLTRWQGDIIVGGFFAVISAILLAIGVYRFRSVSPFPDQSVEEFKENVRWMTNPK